MYKKSFISSGLVCVLYCVAVVQQTIRWNKRLIDIMREGYGMLSLRPWKVRGGFHSIQKFFDHSSHKKSLTNITNRNATPCKPTMHAYTYIVLRIVVHCVALHAFMRSRTWTLFTAWIKRSRNVCESCDCKVSAELKLVDHIYKFSRKFSPFLWLAGLKI